MPRVRVRVHRNRACISSCVARPAVWFADLDLQIEDGNDPRDNDMHGHDYDDDDDESMPSLEEADPLGALHHHNPFRAADDDDDPEEADISQMPQFQNTRIQNTGPGRYHFSATIHQTIPLSGPAFGNNGNGPNTIAGISSFLTDLLLRNGSTRQQGPAEPGDGQGGSSPQSGPDGQPQVHRFTYSSGARLYPRDGDNPGPRLEPVDGLNK